MKIEEFEKEWKPVEKESSELFAVRLTNGAIIYAHSYIVENDVVELFYAIVPKKRRRNLLVAMVPIGDIVEVGRWGVR